MYDVDLGALSWPFSRRSSSTEPGRHQTCSVMSVDGEACSCSRMVHSWTSGLCRGNDASDRSTQSRSHRTVISHHACKAPWSRDQDRRSCKIGALCGTELGVEPLLIGCISAHGECDRTVHTSKLAHTTPFLLEIAADFPVRLVIISSIHQPLLDTANAGDDRPPLSTNIIDHHRYDHVEDVVFPIKLQSLFHYAT